jgi:hypothetical protein
MSLVTLAHHLYQDLCTCIDFGAVAITQRDNMAILGSSAKQAQIGPVPWSPGDVARAHLLSQLDFRRQSGWSLGTGIDDTGPRAVWRAS